MKVVKETIDLQDTTDTITVYLITDGGREIRVTLFNETHNQTEVNEKICSCVI